MFYATCSTFRTTQPGQRSARTTCVTYFDKKSKQISDEAMPPSIILSIQWPRNAAVLGATRSFNKLQNCFSKYFL